MTTAILRQSDGSEFIPSSCIVSCSPKPTNTFAEHILEDGSTVTDNKITNNTEIAVTIILPEDDPQKTFNAIHSASEDTEELIVQTRFITYPKMYVQSFPWAESAEMISTALLNITLKQQRTATVVTTTLPPSKVKNKSDADTVDRGEQLPQSETILSKIGRWFGV